MKSFFVLKNCPAINSIERKCLVLSELQEITFIFTFRKNFDIQQTIFVHTVETAV